MTCGQEDREIGALEKKEEGGDMAAPGPLDEPVPGPASTAIAQLLILFSAETLSQVRQAVQLLVDLEIKRMRSPSYSHRNNVARPACQHKYYMRMYTCPVIHAYMLCNDDDSNHYRKVIVGTSHRA